MKLQPFLALVVLSVTLASSAHAAAPIEQWARRYSQAISSSEQARKVVTDSVGNVIVAGNTGDLGDTGDAGVADMLIIKYSAAGTPLWTNRYDGSARSTDDPTALAVDGNDNVFVTGKSLGLGSGFDYATIAYSSAGSPLWTNRFNGPGNTDDTAQALAVDAAGNVLVTGTAIVNSTNSDYATIKYSGTGVPLWTNFHHGGPYGNVARSLATDSTGNVFVTGYEVSLIFLGSNVMANAYATVAYSEAGAPLWVQRYQVGRTARPNAIAVDRDGNVFVTGTIVTPTFVPGTATVGYSGAGLPLWTNLYGGNAIAADPGRDGNIFVTGSLAGDYGTIAYSREGMPLWTNRYNGPVGGTDQATALAVDRNGNVLITGYSAGPAGNDYTTIAYTGGGVGLWTNRSRGDGFPALAVDGSGKVFVTGSTSTASTFDDWLTIGYSTAGNLLWTNRYNGRGNGSDEAAAVAVDANGNVIVTGTSNGDFLTTAYSAAGSPLWTNRYNGGRATGIAVDANGNVFVLGTISGEYLTIAYSGAGVPLWTNRYPGAAGRTDLARAVVVDGSGNVLVAVASIGGSFATYDFATIKYSGAGVPLWTNRYDVGGPFGQDFPNCMAVDRTGNVYVAGSSYGGGTLDDFVTIAYSSAGVPLWTSRININRYDSVNAIAVASNGNVIITGTSYNEFTWQYVTIAYSANGTVLWMRNHGQLTYAGNTLALDQSGNVFVTGLSQGPGGGDFNYAYLTFAYSSAGVPLWTNRYSGPQNQAAPADIAVDRSGNVIVTGYSRESGGSFDYLTIAYSGAGMPLWTNRYTGLGNSDDRASALAVSPDGAIYVTGASGGDYATVRYVTSQLSILPILPGTPDATLSLWAAPNSSWTIQRAIQPAGAWIDVGTLVTDTNGFGRLHDAPRPAGGAFYRARQP